MSLVNIAKRLEEEAITIPTHQREYVWKIDQQVRLVDSVFRRMPINSITLREKNVKGGFLRSLEDGQQRMTTLKRFMAGAFQYKGRYYMDFSPVERSLFENYAVIVLTYSNATDEEAIEIFNNLQNGSTMTHGERLYSQASLSPLARFTIEMLLTPGSGFYDRTILFWGSRPVKAKRGANMTIAFAICAGLAHGSDFISKSWSSIDQALWRSFDSTTVHAKLKLIVETYEFIYNSFPTETKKCRNIFWDPANFTAYMIHGLVLTQEREPRIEIPSHTEQMAKWKQVLLAFLTDKTILTNIHRDIDIAGAWKFERWHNGWRRVFALESFKDVPVDDDSDDVDSIGSE